MSQQDLADAMPFAGKTVLLVEDNVRLRPILLRSLEAVGCQVLAASCAADAVTLIEQGAQPDLLLTDVRMPGSIDGVALGRWVRVRSPTTKVLLQTGFSLAQDSPFRKLEKPFTLEELIAAMHAVFSIS